jgi:hypothetical protein
MGATYYEIVVKGDRRFLQGFVLGVGLDQAVSDEFWFCRDHPVESEHVEQLRLRGHYIHLVCTVTVRKKILPSLEQADEFGVKVVSDRKIARTYFEFEFDTVSRDVAATIKRILRTLPAGLKVLAYEPKETEDKSAKGVELYSPVHDYRFEGSGRVEGDFAELLAVRKKLEAIDWVKPGDISILLA